MPSLILLNKPFHVLSQFTDDNGRTTLKDFIRDKPGFYVAGRLDYDSEGLLVLTDHGPLQHYIAHPSFDKEKTYWVQVEGDINDNAIAQLMKGVTLKDGLTKPCIASRIEAPHNLWHRTPPIRDRKNIPTSWLSLTITEGKNRQVRRMTAAVGFPTLRLVRASIGEWSVDDLQPGEFKEINVKLPKLPTTAKLGGRRNTHKTSRTANSPRVRHSNSKPPRSR